MKKNNKVQVYILNGTTFLTYNDYMRAYRQKRRNMHNWQVPNGLFSKGKMWKPLRQGRRIQLNKCRNWEDRHDAKVAEQWEREHHQWSWERI